MKSKMKITVAGKTGVGRSVIAVAIQKMLEQHGATLTTNADIESVWMDDLDDLPKIVSDLNLEIEEVNIRSFSTPVRTETIDDLIKKTGDDVWKSHPRFPRQDWMYEVENGDTILGYWEWVWVELEKSAVPSA